MTIPPPMNREDTGPRLRQRLPNLSGYSRSPRQAPALEQNGRLNDLTEPRPSASGFPKRLMMTRPANGRLRRPAQILGAVLIVAGLALLLLVLLLMALQGFWREALFGQRRSCKGARSLYPVQTHAERIFQSFAGRPERRALRRRLVIGEETEQYDRTRSTS
jgi:hypothetical protein